MIMPINGHPSNTMTIPPKKHSDDLIFFRCTKNRNVLSKPMIQANPHINKIYGDEWNESVKIIDKTELKYKLLWVGHHHTFPIARRPLSKRSRMPRNTNATPNPARPTPISAGEHENRQTEIFCQIRWLYKKRERFALTSIHYSLCVSVISNILLFTHTIDREEYLFCEQNPNFQFCRNMI